MKTLKERLGDGLHIAVTIASKDVADALRNRNTRTNILLLVGLVAFFHWGLTVRPFDRQHEVVVYDQGQSSLQVTDARLEDGSEFTFYQASSLEEMKRMMVYRDLGLVLPADLDRTLASGGEPTLTGYIFWARRGKASQLEAEYTRQLSELVGRPLRVRVGDNVLVPEPDALGHASTAAFHLFFAAFWMAFSVVPHLMYEERTTRTLDALLVSPASAGQVVLGKALAGLFYVVLSGGLAFALNAVYLTNWGLALLAFACSALFAIGLALAVGSLVNTPQQLALWAQPVVFILLLPAFFAQEPNLVEGVRAVISALPTVALTNLFGLALASRAPAGQLATYLAIALAGTALAFGVVVWKVRRSDR